MESDFIATLLATDIHALAAAVPSDKPPDPTELDVLQPLLEVCGTEWIREFLFTDDPVHIPHLMSGNLSMNAFIVDVNIARVAPIVPQPDPSTLYGENQAFLGRYFFVPAFTVQHTTVGVGVVDAAETKDSPWLPNGHSRMDVRLNLRFVHDASKRNIFSVIDQPEQDRVALHCCCVDPFDGPYFLRAMLNRTKLRSVIHGPRWNFDCTAVLPALQSFIHTAQYRPCTKCGTSSACLCYYAAVVPPTHPFDLQHFRTAMSHEFGVYRGITNILLFDDGRQVSKVTIGGSHSLVQGAFDPSSVQKLSYWSISQHARKLLEDPRQSLSLMTHGELAHDDTSDQVGYDTVANIVGEVFPPQPLPETVDDVLGSTTAPNPSRTLLAQGLESYEGFTFRESPERFGLIVGRDYAQVQAESMGNRGTMTTTGDELDMGSEWWARQFDTDSARALQAASRQGTSGMHSAVSKEFPVHSSSTQGTPVVATVEGTTNGATSSPSRPSSASEAPVDVRALMKKMRDEDRKERNRASARRSNEQNRSRREDMQRELASGHEKISELRAKENELRRENLQIRTSLKEQG